MTDRRLSVPEILASLEQQLPVHREQEGRHAEREAFHREQREPHAAEIEALSRRLDELRAVSAAAMDLPSGPHLLPRWRAPKTTTIRLRRRGAV